MTIADRNTRLTVTVDKEMLEEIDKLVAVERKEWDKEPHDVSMTPPNRSSIVRMALRQYISFEKNSRM